MVPMVQEKLRRVFGGCGRAISINPELWMQMIGPRPGTIETKLDTSEVIANLVVLLMQTRGLLPGTTEIR